MIVQTAQAKVKAERVTDVQVGANKLFAAIDAAHPEGIRYAWLLLPDGETFVAVVQVDDGVKTRSRTSPSTGSSRKASRTRLPSRPTPNR